MPYQNDRAPLAGALFFCMKDKLLRIGFDRAKMGRNEAVSMETLGKICCALECEIGDIVENENKEKNNR